MPQASAKILIIDDEPNLLLGLAALLRRAGYQPITANNGAEGSRLAQTLLPDLIVCDVMMPPPNGLELRTQLASNTQTANIPFIFLTARTQQHDKNTALALGVDDYITKPFDRQELLLRIQAVLRRQALGRQIGWQDSQTELAQFKQNIIRTFNHEFHTPLPVILATLEIILRRSFENAPERSQTLIQAALYNTEKTKAIIADLAAMGQFDQNTTQLIRDPIDIQVDFIWPLQDLFKQFAPKMLQVQLILEPDVTNWASVFRSESADPDPEQKTRIVVRAPRFEFTQAIRILVHYACSTSPEHGSLQVNLAYNGFGGCVLTVSRQGFTLSSDMTESFFAEQQHLAQARQFARRMGGDLTILDTVAGGRLRMILPPGK